MLPTAGVVRGRRNPLHYGLPERLKKVRQGRGLSKRKLADRADMGASVVQAIEADVRVPLIDTVERLARALGVPACWLAYGYLGGRPFQDKVPRDEQIEGVPEPQPAMQQAAPLASLEVGARLARAREHKGFSRNALGKASGLSGQGIANIEEKGRMPGLDTAEQLAGALGVSACWLAYGEGEGAGE